MLQVPSDVVEDDACDDNTSRQEVDHISHGHLLCLNGSVFIRIIREKSNPIIRISREEGIFSFVYRSAE